MEGIVLSFADDPEREDNVAFMSAHRSISAIKSESLFAEDARVSLLQEIKLKRLISITSANRMRWELFVLILALFNSFSVPFEIAFFPDGIGEGMLIANVVVDAVYFIDIVVHARSTYMDESGTEVIDSGLIFRRYLFSGKLIVDVVAAIPFEFLELVSTKSLKLVALLKMLRLLRLSKIIRYMRSKDKVKYKLKLMQMMFLLILFLHLQACFWFLLIAEEEKYIPPAMYVHGTTLYPSTVWRQYAYSLYMSVYMLTAAEIGPRTEWERIFAGCLIITGQLFQAFMFGQIAVVLFNLNAKTSHIAEVEEASATTMLNMRLPSRLQNKVMSYLVQTQASSSNQTEFEEFFNILPPSLKQEVRCLLFKPSLELNTELGKNSKIISSILLRLTNLYCLPETRVVTQGDVAEDLYFIIKGRCIVFVLDQHKAPHRVNTLTKGSHFGEIGLVYNSPRTATVKTTGHATLAILSRKDFHTLVDKYPKLLNIFRRSAIKYNDPWKRFLVTTLKQCPFLRETPASVLHEVMFQLPTARVEPNTYICRDGDTAENVTFIVDGIVEVYAPVNDMRLISFPSDARLNHEMEFTHKMRFRRGSMMAIKKTKDMRYIVKISMDQLGIGSVILPNLALMRGKVHFYAKATELTVVLQLNQELLKTLCKKYSELRDSVDKYRRELQNMNDSARFQFTSRMSLDYDKYINVTPVTNEQMLWNAKMLVRRCAMGRILRQRSDRTALIVDFATMRYKIQAILDAQGNQELIEKIRRAAVPKAGIPQLWGLDLLSLEEVNKPLLTQFAFQASKVVRVFEFFANRLFNLIRLVHRMLAKRVKAQNELYEMRTLVRLALRLRNL